jgi:hypothetical protein
MTFYIRMGKGNASGHMRLVALPYKMGAHNVSNES